MRVLLAGLVVAQVASQAFVWQDPRIDESSGLVDLGATMVTTNDSGDTGRLFVVDETGATVRTVDLGVAVRDVEALAPAGDGRVWVGDVGDNQRARDDLAAHRVDLDDGSVQSYPLAYADGRSYDAESLVELLDGRLAVVTKGLAGQVWTTSGEPRAGQVNLLQPGPRVGGLATDAALDPVSGLVLVRGYGGASLHELPSWRRVGEVPLPDQPQGEAVSIGPDGRVRVSSEGAGTPVLQLDAPLAAWTLPPVLGRFVEGVLGGAGPR